MNSGFPILRFLPKTGPPCLPKPERLTRPLTMKMHTSSVAAKRTLWPRLTTLIGLPLLASTLEAQVNFTTLVEFTGTAGNYKGRSPMSGLYLGSDGSFYGTTRYGGTADVGTVYK